MKVWVVWLRTQARSQKGARGGSAPLARPEPPRGPCIIIRTTVTNFIFCSPMEINSPPMQNFLATGLFELFGVWPWTLTTNRHVRSKIVSPSKACTWLPYLTSIDTFSLSRTVPEIFDFKVFRVRPWLSTFKSHVTSKCLHYLKAIHDFLSNFHWHILSISFRSRDIWLQKIFGFYLELWPWNRPLKVTWGQKISPFESPCMTSI